MSKRILVSASLLVAIFFVSAQQIQSVLEEDNLAQIKEMEVLPSDVLHQAIEQGSTSIVDYLLDLRTYNNSYDSAGQTPLFVAVNKRDKSLVSKLLKRGADPNLKSTSGLEATPLMWASGSNSTEIVGLLIKSGADVNVGDKNGDPALNWATYYGYVETMKLLIDKGADLSIKSKHGTPADVGLRLWHADSVMEVFRATGYYGKNKKAENYWVAMKNGDKILDYPADMTDVLETPLLHLAAETGNLEATKKLIANGADPNQMNRVGQTALTIAARFGRFEIAKFLLEKGADPGLSGDDYKLSPLIGAAVGGNLDIGKLLLEEGAPIDHTDVVNECAALHWSLLYGKQDFANMLLNSGAAYKMEVMDGAYTAENLATLIQLKEVQQTIAGLEARDITLGGSWSLKSIDYIVRDTTYHVETTYPGALVVAPKRYSIMYSMSDKGREPFGNLSKPTDEEVLAGFRSIVFNSGNYQIDEDNNFVTTADMAKVPGFEGGIQYYAIDLQGDQLALTLHDETYPNGKKPEWFGKLKVKLSFYRE